VQRKSPVADISANRQINDESLKRTASGLRSVGYATQGFAPEIDPPADEYELFHVRSLGAPLERVSNLARCFAADVITAAFKFGERCIP